MTERETLLAQFEGFDTWADVLAHVSAEGSVYYHPPMNYAPVVVRAQVRAKKVRVTPYDREADPFTADEGHLSRFLRRKVQR